MKTDHTHAEPSKQRALRIPLSYVRGGDGIQRWKLLLSLVAVHVTVAYVTWAIMGRTGPTAFSHGPVAQAHAAWESSCAACHVDFVPLRDDAVNPLAKSGLVPALDASRGDLPVPQRADHKCQTCHAGPRHHENELPTDVGACTSCHPDHRGRDAQIARPSDAVCTRCHANIASHRRRGAPSSSIPPTENVLHFHNSAAPDASTPHPEFRSLLSDPGNIKFHHHMHLTAGIPPADRQGQGRKLLTLADLPPEFVEQYRRPDQPRGAKADREYPVQLDCSSCHRLDATDDRSAATVRTKAPSTGEYMLPVSFENDCRACHHLNYEPAPNKEIKHGANPAEAREFLFGRYLYEAKAGKLAESATRLVPRRVIPGRSPEDTSPHGVPEHVDAQVAAAERYLRETNACAKCHFFKTTGRSPTDFGLPDVQPTDIPAVWLQRARFDHAAHRTVACAECHAQAFPARNPTDPPSMARDQDVVMIGGRGVCLKCHSPGSATGTSGGARFDCVECHRYHGAGDSPRVQKQE